MTVNQNELCSNQQFSEIRIYYLYHYLIINIMNLIMNYMRLIDFREGPCMGAMTNCGPIGKNFHNCESDEENYMKYISPSYDINHYNDLFRRKMAVKKMAKVIINRNCISECWKYFGDLYICKRQILEKYKFCKICFEAENMILKGLYFKGLESQHQSPALDSRY
ncbi:hypothetical protein FF38_08653 [Lucilia cuprina]|uniref:Uncharacterized protein n=1 Tax=Lucilia cuprina TaxID=7375 RepID=A0A0L0CCW1_LUCCU|nr:hypothetical protein FF38_08653 [Lucilia cuprina]